MPAPTNTSKATATVIPALPYSITQDANDSGVTNDLWFTRTADATDTVWGALASGVSPYTPETILVLEDDTQQILGDPNTPIQYAPTIGDQYWFKCHNVGGNHPTADLTFSLELGPAEGFSAGDIFIPDDQTEGSGFPGVSINPTTGAVVHMIGDCPNGESAEILSTGQIFLQDVGDVGTTSPTMKLYSSASALNQGIIQATIPYTYVPGLTTRAMCRLCDHSAFYFTDLTGVNSFTLYQVTPLGVKTVKDTIGSTTGISAIAPNVANTKLYVSGKTGTSDSTIRTWNLSTHSYDADFAAAIAGYNAIADLVTLTTDHVVAVYQKNTATRDLLVKVYDAAGTELASQSFGSAILSGASRIFHAADDTAHVWLRRINDGNTLSYFKLNTTTLATITTFDTQAFQEGVNVSGDPDPDRFGTSITCAGIVLAGSSVTTQSFPIRRQRRFLVPSSENQYKMQIPTLNLLMRTGIGLTPGPATDPAVVGSDPTVMYRFSKDGGLTWSPERTVSAGKIGEYLRRARITRATGQYRNGVVEITVSDPVDWQFLEAIAEPGIIEGSS